MRFTKPINSLYDLEIGDYIYVKDALFEKTIKTKIINKKYFKISGDNYISLKFQVYDYSGNYEYDNIRFKVHSYAIKRKELKYYTLYCNDARIKTVDYIYD